MPDACPRCALPSPGNAICGECLLGPPPLRLTVAAYRYAFPIDRMVQALKYGGQLAMAQWFGHALADAVNRHASATTFDIDWVVALPLAAARQRQRGFNQSGEIARETAKRLDRPRSHGLQRIRDTPPQATLPVAERVRNMRGAFVATRRFDGARIALVDDVMTSGATLHAAAAALRRARAHSVDAWVVARALR